MFDGDTMSFYLIPEEFNEDVEKCSPKKMMIYRKNMKPLFTPNHEVLTGLYIASKVKLVETPMEFNSIDEVNPDEVDENELIYVDGKLTTYHRYQLDKILEGDLDSIIGDKKLISAKNIVDIMTYLERFEDRVQKIGDLQRYALEVVTLTGVTTMTYAQIYRDLPQDLIDSIHEIEKSDLDKRTKLYKIENLYGKYLEDMKSGLPNEVQNRMNSSDRLKMSSLLAILTPQLYIEKDGSSILTTSTLANGMNMDDYIDHCIDNRKIQDIKKFSVPLAGYLTRQLVHTGEQYVYRDDIIDNGNTGILLPMNVAEGRTDMDGNLIGKSDSDELVRVKSVITCTINDVITKDCLNPRLVYDNGDYIGISFLTSTTEKLTQSGLSLKHGGRLYNLDDSGVLKAPSDCLLREDEGWVYLDTNEGEMKFPKPENFSIDYKEKYAKGDVIGYAYKVVNPAYSLDATVRFLKAQGVSGSKEHEKSEINFTDCYSVSEGKIVYLDRQTAKIGNVSYKIHPSSMCYYPEGTDIQVGQRFASGIQDMRSITTKTSSVEISYLIFRSQFITLMGSMTEELIEFLYKVLMRVNIDSNNLVFAGVHQTANNTGSILRDIAYQGAESKLKRLAGEGGVIKDDPFTNLLINDMLLRGANDSN